LALHDARPDKFWEESDFTQGDTKGRDESYEICGEAGRRFEGELAADLVELKN
jgi:hypothetical protein